MLSTDLLEIYDADTLLYRAGFSVEHRDYIADLGQHGVQIFENHKNYKAWLKLQEDLQKHGLLSFIDNHVLWVDHQVGPVENAIHNLKLIIESCHNKLKGFEQRFFLTGKDNFRYKIATIKPYHWNRDPSHKPVHYEALREYLVKHLLAEIVNGKEADDACGVLASKDPNHSVIISNDKDLRQIPCYHYDFTKPEEKPIFVDKRTAGLYFYQQVLTGDSTDGVPGIEGLGPTGARKILEGCKNPAEAEDRVLREYRSRYGEGEGDRRFLETARLVRIHKTDDELQNLWKPVHVKLNLGELRLNDSI